MVGCYMFSNIPGYLSRNVSHVVCFFQIRMFDTIAIILLDPIPLPQRLFCRSTSLIMEQPSRLTLPTNLCNQTRIATNLCRWRNRLFSRKWNKWQKTTGIFWFLCMLLLLSVGCPCFTLQLRSKSFVQKESM